MEVDKIYSQKEFDCEERKVVDDNELMALSINVNDQLLDIIKNIRSDASEYGRLMAYYRCAIMEVETKFNVLNVELSRGRESNPIETIKSRLKSPESIVEKLQRKNIPMDVASIEKNLFDIAGVRVICAFQEDIYMLADSLAKQDDVKVLEVKDYIKHPKDNGYRSLHLIVEIPIFLLNEKRFMKVEVQLRTIAMDFWASLEHKIRYKKNLQMYDEYSEISDRLKQCADQSAALDNMMDETHKMIIGLKKRNEEE